MKSEDKIEVELLENGQFEVRTGPASKKRMKVAVLPPEQPLPNQPNGVDDLIDLLKRSFSKR